MAPGLLSGFSGFGVSGCGFRIFWGCGFKVKASQGAVKDPKVITTIR